MARFDSYSLRRWILEIHRDQLLEELSLQQKATDTATDAGARVQWLPRVTVDTFLDWYCRVGERWGWFDRRLLPVDRLNDLLQSDAREFGRFSTRQDHEIGFTELCRHRGGHEIEIAYFGLFPEFIGRGFGRSLFLRVLQRAAATSENLERIWLSTCEWDSPAALPFYQSFGFQIVDEQIVRQQVPAGWKRPQD